VTVGMMTTGYDCEDILNVVLARPIMSPTDFIQIKGRGTRLFTFKHQDGENEQRIDKNGFGLFDFFANCEYFEEDFNYNQKRIRRLLFEKPEEFWNLPKLQEIYKTDRSPSLREILGKIFGVIPTIPTRAQLADEAYERFVATQNTNAVHSRELRTVFVAFLLDPRSRHLLEQGKFTDLRARDPNLHAALSALPAEERDALVRYLKTEVSLKDFEKAA